MDDSSCLQNTPYQNETGMRVLFSCEEGVKEGCEGEWEERGTKSSYAYENKHI